MAKRKETSQAQAQADTNPRKLTWQEERFIEEYLDNGGNATAAYHDVYGGLRTSAGELGHRLLKKVEIKDAIERERDRMRTASRVSRDKVIRSLSAIAFTTVDEVADALSKPYDQDSYLGLGHKRHAIQATRTPEGWIATVASIKERKEALIELWDILGLGKEGSAGNWFDGLDGLLDLARKVKSR